MADNTQSQLSQALQSDLTSFQKKMEIFAPSAKSTEMWSDIRNDTDQKRDSVESEENVVHYHVSRKSFVSLLLGYGYLMLCAAFIGKALYGFSRAFLFGDSDMVEPKFMSVLLLLGGIGVFMVLTVFDYWNIQTRIRMYVVTLICVFGIIMAQVWYKLSYAIVVPLLLKPEPNIYVTDAKWMFLIRILTIFPTVLLTFVCVRALVKVIWDEMQLTEIEEFRLVEHLDLRKGKRYKYDMKIIRNRFDGGRYTITEDQRNLHMIVNGSTGTGKSSMILEPMANDDLIKRCKNEDKQIKEVVKLLKSNDAYLNRPVKGRYDFSLDAVTPTTDKGTKRLNDIALTYKKIGYTVLCPDSSMTDHIAELAINKGIDVNIIDPEYDEKTGKFKTGTKGFNPLYISPRVPESERQSVIASRAVLVAEILTKLNSLKGEGDPYFVGLNRTVTETIAITLLVTFPVKHGRQPNIVDVQLCINDFDRLKPYADALKEINKALPDHPYTFVTDFIFLHLLGEGRKEMVTQAKGLQMLVNEFLTQDRVKFLLCAPDDATIDMDEMLEQGQITVVNFGLRFGPVISTGFALFFMLSFINATMRRPGSEKTRIPHVFVIDELARCLHPDLESEISLARKYRVAFVGAIQSLSQFGQSPVTRYMEEVVLGGCAHHIVFGRCGVEEMDRYSKLAGTGWRHKEVDTVSETSITTDNPTYSYSKRTELEEADNLRGTDLQNRHFKECTVFTSSAGAPVPPFFARVNFLEKSAYNTLKRKKYNWEELYSKYGIASTTPSERTMEKVEETLEKKNDFSDFDFSQSLFDTDVSFFGTDEEGTTSTAEEAVDEEAVNGEEAVVVTEEKKEYSELKEGYMRSDTSGGMDL